MRRRKLRGLVLAAAAGIGAAAAPCAAQVDARLDATAAIVKYDGFLSSGAASFSPAVAWRSVGTTVAARGTLLFFESGNTSFQGLFSASTFTAPLGRARLEVAGEAGGSGYSAYGEVQSFVHALAQARLHLMWNRWGLFAGGLAGAAGAPAGTGGASGVTAGGWVRGTAGTLGFTWTYEAVGDSSYDELEARARLVTGPMELEATGGTLGSGAGLPRGYGDVSATLRLTGRIRAVVALGSFARDPIRGTIAGHYLSAGIRLATRASAGPAVAPTIAPPAAPGPRRSPWLSDARVVVEQRGDESVLIVLATDPHTVEVMGDFTDWRPVALARDGAGRWRCDARLASGLLRFNVRLDGGAWGVPQGAALGADDFGSGVAVMVVP